MDTPGEDSPVVRWMGGEDTGACSSVVGTTLVACTTAVSTGLAGRVGEGGAEEGLAAASTAVAGSEAGRRMGGEGVGTELPAARRPARCDGWWLASEPVGCGTPWAYRWTTSSPGANHILVELGRIWKIGRGKGVWTHVKGEKDAGKPCIYAQETPADPEWIFA